MARSRSKYVNVQCFQCRKWGHKARDCDRLHRNAALFGYELSTQRPTKKKNDKDDDESNDTNDTNMQQVDNNHRDQKPAKKERNAVTKHKQKDKLDFLMKHCNLSEEQLDHEITKFKAEQKVKEARDQMQLGK